MTIIESISPSLDNQTIVKVKSAHSNNIVLVLSNGREITITAAVRGPFNSGVLIIKEDDKIIS